VIEVVILALTVLTAATIAGVTGSGGAIVLLPVLVWAVGARDAVIALTVARRLGGRGARRVYNASIQLALTRLGCTLGARRRTARARPRDV
jgi:uncharacterized membrane protein YfcA